MTPEQKQIEAYINVIAELNKEIAKLKKQLQQCNQINTKNVINKN